MRKANKNMQPNLLAVIQRICFGSILYENIFLVAEYFSVKVLN